MASNYNIGPRIGIEGEKEFRAQISRINSEYKSMDSYLKTVEKSMEAQGRTQELLASKSNGLRQQIAKQEQAYKQYSDALEKIKNLEGDHTEEIMRYEGALLHTKSTQAALERELDKTETELKQLADGLEVVGEAADTADDKVLSFGDILAAGIASGAILGALREIGDVIVDVGQQAIEAAADVKAANAQFSQTFGNLESTATAALRNISNETGIAVTRLQGGYTALYAFTKSVGGDSDTALNIAQRALTAAADSAAYYDRTVEDATETLQSFLKGNYANDAALGIAATETTRNAKANELYAKSFKELSEAQKVDVLLAMVEAGNAASGALGQAARETDAWANVTGELSEVWKQMLANTGAPVLEGLIPIMAGVNEQLNALLAPRPINTLNEGLADFRDGIQAAGAALDDSNSSIAAQADLAQRYVDRLRQIEAAGTDTAEAQREYAQTVELLNEVMPGLNLTINENTGRLDQNTWAIEDNIRALKDQAEQQAKLSYYQDIMSSYEGAYKSRFAAEKELVALQAKEIELSKRLTAATEEYAAAEGEAKNAAYNRFLMARADYNRNILQQDDLKASLEALGIEIEEYGSILDEATRETSDLAGATGTATASANALNEEVASLKAVYADSKTAAKDAIDSQIGLFDELADKSEMSAEEIVANWKKQQESFGRYEENLKKAVDLGLDETLVEQLSDGSEQSMLILDELVNGTELSIDEINAAFRDRMTSEDSLAEHMAKMEAIANGTWDRMVEAAKQAGYNTPEGLAKGIRDGVYLVENAMRDMGKKAQVAFNRTMEIQSPSRVMERAGGYTVAGAVQGIERNARDLENAMRELAIAGNNAYLREQVDYASNYPTMAIGAAGYGTGATTTNNSHVAYGGISININTQPGQDARSIADAVVQELTVMLGQEEAAFG